MPLNEALIAFRHDTHRVPELSGTEFQTALRIEAMLDQWGLTDYWRIANTGILLRIASATEGKRILFRADTDALPIQEVGALPYQSETPGAMHACGHDGHSAILLGLAARLAEHPPETGSVFLLFQPAEETGEGAAACLADSAWPAEPMDAVFALHNLPHFPLGAVVVCDAAFSAQVHSVAIVLTGKTAHAAEPEHGQSPGLAMADILRYAASESINDASRPDFLLLTPVHAKLGELAYGISPGTGEVHLTLRCWDPALMDQQRDLLEAFVQQTASRYNLHATCTWLQGFASTQNDSLAMASVRHAVKEADLPLVELEQGFKWGEDFGLFTQRYPGAMFGLGSGLDTPALHNPDYDFPDALIGTGADLFFRIAQRYTNPT